VRGKGAEKLDKEKRKVFEGVVEKVIPNWWSKKDGSKIPGIKLRNHEVVFVSWHGGIKSELKAGDKIRIRYYDWIPNSNIPPHHVIQNVEVMETTSEPSEAAGILKEIDELLEKLKARIVELKQKAT